MNEASLLLLALRCFEFGLCQLVLRHQPHIENHKQGHQADESYEESSLELGRVLELDSAPPLAAPACRRVRRAPILVAPRAARHLRTIVCSSALFVKFRPVVIVVVVLVVVRRGCPPNVQNQKRWERDKYSSDYSDLEFRVVRVRPLGCRVARSDVAEERSKGATGRGPSQMAR